MVVLGFFTSTSIAEPVCGELASNMNATSASPTWNNQFLAQSFEVTGTVMLSAVSIKIVATIHSDNNTKPGVPLPGGSLVVPSIVGGGSSYERTFTVNTTATGNTDGLYLSKGFYWLVVGAPDDNYLSMLYINSVIAPNTSMPIAIHNLAVRVTATTAWRTYENTSVNGQFRFSASGCDLSLRQSPTASSTPMASASASVSPARSSNPNPSRSPIPAKIVALVANVTANFDSTPAAEVQVTAPLSSSDAKSALGVSSQFAGLVVGNATVPASSLTSFTRTTRNETTEAGEHTATTYVYAAHVDNATQLEQAFTFHATNKPTQFAGTSFTIGSGSIKWSVNLTKNNTDVTDDNISSSAAGITMKYRLTGLLGNSSQVNTSSDGVMGVRKVSNSPHANMTTYFLSFASSGDDGREAGCAVELFDVALVDGSEEPVPISHEINIVSDATTSNAEFELALHFPVFERSLVYDPSISLGVLLGGRDELGGSGGDDNMGMIIAVAVAVPVAVVIVLVVIAAGTLVIVQKRKREVAKLRKNATETATLEA